MSNLARGKLPASIFSKDASLTFVRGKYGIEKTLNLGGSIIINGEFSRSQDSDKNEDIVAYGTTIVNDCRASVSVQMDTNFFCSESSFTSLKNSNKSFFWKTFRRNPMAEI